MTPYKEFDESLLDIEIYPYFFMCECCGFVDNNPDCLNVTHSCSFCKKEGHSGVIYFHANIHAIIRLMAQIYQLKPSKKDWRHAESQSHRFTVIILFSTLGELLLNRFLGELMTAQQLPNIRNIYYCRSSNTQKSA